MYLIELILKKWFEKQKKQPPVLFKYKEEQEEEICEKHVYMAIDSTCDYLACKNCGHIIKNNKKEISKKTRALYDKFDNF